MCINITFWFSRVFVVIFSNGLQSQVYNRVEALALLLHSFFFFFQLIKISKRKWTSHPEVNNAVVLHQGLNQLSIVFIFVVDPGSLEPLRQSCSKLFLRPNEVLQGFPTL